MSGLDMGMWDREYPSEEESTEAEATFFEEEDGEEEYQQEDSFDIEDMDISQYEDEDSQQDIMDNARIRLEQGRLYEMLIKHDLFDGVDALPQAISNVQKEMKNFIMERLEILLGMRAEKEPVQQVIYDSQFNDMEIKVLKMIASTATKGASKDSPTSAPVKSELNTFKEKPKANKLNSLGSGSKKPTTKSAPPQKAVSRPLPKRTENRPERKLKKEILEVGTGNMALDDIAKRDMKYVESLKSLPLEEAAKVVAQRHNRPKSKIAINQDVVNAHYGNKMAMNETANIFSALLANAKNK